MHASLRDRRTSRSAEPAQVSPSLPRAVAIACAMSLPVWIGALFAIFG